MENNKLKKVSILITNIIIIVLMFYLQNERYLKIRGFQFEKFQDEVLRSVGMIQASGNDINWILGNSIMLLVLNLFLLRKWAESKKWILEGILIFTVTIILSFTYHVQRMSEFNNRIKTTANTGYNSLWHLDSKEIKNYI